MSNSLIFGGLELAAPGSPYAGLYAILIPSHRSAGTFEMVVQIDAGIENADQLVSDFLYAVTEGTGVTPVFNQRRTLPWLHAMTWPGLGEPGDVFTRRYKLKAGYLRRSLTDG